MTAPGSSYSEIHHDETSRHRRRVLDTRQRTGSPTTASRCERVLTDNGSCYKSRLGRTPAPATGTTVKKTRPHRPQTNGKIERFHRILLEEWAYIRPWNSDRQRHPPTTDSSTSTITTAPTARSAGQPQPQPSTTSGTTSPANTASVATARGRGRLSAVALGERMRHRIGQEFVMGKPRGEPALSGGHALRRRNARQTARAVVA